MERIPRIKRDTVYISKLITKVLKIQFDSVSGDRADMRAPRGGADGARARVRRLADGGWLAAGPVHALHRPQCAHASALRHHRPTRLLRR